VRACAPVAFADAMLAQHELDRVTAADRCVGGEGGGRSKWGGALEEKGPIEERRGR
jgi:hypothetical protein